MKLSSYLKDKTIANGLPALAYTDEEFWMRECETVFADNWVFVGFAHELSNLGDVLPISVAGKPVLLVKNKNSNIVAFHNVCSHRCLKLVDQPKNVGKIIRCPYHSWSYDLDGNLLASPHFGGINNHKPSGFIPADHGLESIRIKVWHDWIFINLSKRIKLEKNELKKLIQDQLEIISGIANAHQWPITHVKPHGALNNMACENFDVGHAIGESIYEFNKDLIYLVLPLSEMEKAAQQLNLKYACEIFADRNYQDNGQLISRSNPNAMVENFKTASENILEMLHNSSIKCLSGKKIKCQIDSICIHGDGLEAVSIAKELKKVLIENNIQLVNLDKLN